MENNKIERFKKFTSDGSKYYFFKSSNEIIKLVEENRSHVDASEQREKSYENFYGTKNMDEALDLYKFGWDEGVKKINSKIKMINYKFDVQNKFDVIGSHVSVPRYLNGHPQSMIRKTQVQRKDIVINLVRFSSVTSSVNSNELIENGAKFIALIQNLESQGYRCNVDVVFASNKGHAGDYQFVRVRIKNSNERLNVAKMSFPMCHPSMFRRFIFKLRELEYGTSDGFTSWNSSGRSEYEIQRCKEKIKPFLDKNDYFVPLFIDDPENFKLEKIA